MMAIMIIVTTMAAMIMAMYATGKVSLLWLFGFVFDIQCGITNKKYENSMF